MSQVQIGTHRFTEQSALAALDEHRKGWLKELFTDTNLAYPRSGLLRAGRSVQKQAQAVQQQTSEALAAGVEKATEVPREEARSRAMELLYTVVPADLVPEISFDLGVDLVPEFATSVIPFVGTIKHGVKACMNWTKAAQKGWKARQTARHKGALRAGDPRAACDAVRRILQRDRNHYITDASLDTAAAGASAGLIFVDGGLFSGPAVGAARSAAALLHTVYAIARDYRDMTDGNEQLETPEYITAEIFQVCPVLGAYYLTCSNTSDIINFLTSDMGRKDWMLQIESLARTHVHPLQIEAARCIHNCRFKLEGLKDNRGAFLRDPSVIERMKAKAEKSFKEKFASLFKR